MNFTILIMLLIAFQLGAAEIRSIQIIPGGTNAVLNLAVSTEDGHKTVQLPYRDLSQEARGDWATCATLAQNPANGIVPEGGGLVQIIVEPRGKTSDFVPVECPDKIEGCAVFHRAAVPGTERMVFDFFWTVQRNGSMREVKASSESMPKPFRICCESLWNIIHAQINQ